MRLLGVVITTVILQIFSVVLFSIFSVVNGFTEMKKTPKCENTLSDHDSVHRHRNLNYTQRPATAHHRNFNAPKICRKSSDRKAHISSVSKTNYWFVLCDLQIFSVDWCLSPRALAT